MIDDQAHLILMWIKVICVWHIEEDRRNLLNTKMHFLDLSSACFENIIIVPYFKTYQTYDLFLDNLDYFYFDNYYTYKSPFLTGYLYHKYSAVYYPFIHNNYPDYENNIHIFELGELWQLGFYDQPLISGFDDAYISIHVLYKYFTLYDTFLRAKRNKFLRNIILSNSGSYDYFFNRARFHKFHFYYIQDELTSLHDMATAK